MKRSYYTLLILGFITACSTEPEVIDPKKNEPDTQLFKYADIIPVSDTLFSASGEAFEYGTSHAFVNKQGDTIIPAGEFDHCFSNIFTTFAYVSDKRFGDQGMVAVNRNKEVIFEAYIFDNGPDYIQEDLFRIVRNGKIGFADPTGKVVIEAIYSCAYPFENGKAKVALNCETIQEDEHSSWESNDWFYINKEGNKIR